MKKLFIPIFCALALILGWQGSAQAKPTFSSGSHSSGGGSHSLGGGLSSYHAVSTPTRSSFSSSYTPKTSSFVSTPKATPTPTATPKPSASFGVASTAKGSGAKALKFSSGSTSTDVASGKTYGASAIKPSTWNSGAAAAQSSQQSAADYSAYVASKTPSKPTFSVGSSPKPTYTAPNGASKPIRDSDPEVAYLRGHYDGTTYANRQARQSTFYSRYNTPQYSTVIHHYDGYYGRRYSDPYDNDFIYHWLILQSLTTQSDWIYNHQANLDQQRLNDLYAQNAALRSQVAVMQTNRIPVNSAYIPPALKDQARLLKAGDTAGAAQAEADANAKQSEWNDKNATHQQTLIAYAKIKGQYDSAAKEITDAQERIAQNTRQAETLGKQIQISETVKTAVTTASEVREAGVSGVGSNQSRAAIKAKELIQSNFAAAETEQLYTGAGHDDPAAELNKRLAARRANTQNVDQLAARKKALGLDAMTPAPVAAAPAIAGATA